MEFIGTQTNILVQFTTETEGKKVTYQRWQQLCAKDEDPFSSNMLCFFF